MHKDFSSAFVFASIIFAVHIESFSFSNYAATQRINNVKTGIHSSGRMDMKGLRLFASGRSRLVSRRGVWTMQSEAKAPKVVVVGAGWSGWAAAKALCENGCEVFVLDR
jgi:NADPH-dependent 2,4-dienoyl-CoA reductase/sulfur reductase-like enzyme